MGKDTKQRKAKERERRNKKAVNERRNVPKTPFGLYVNFPPDPEKEREGGWMRVSGFRDMKGVREYVSEQKAIRDEGKTEIWEGKVKNKFGVDVAHIPAYIPSPSVDLSAVMNPEPVKNVAFSDG